MNRFYPQPVHVPTNLPERKGTLMLEIYYIEDDEAIAQSVQQYLTAKNMQVHIFPRLSEARRALLAHTPSAVLVDWNMPDGQGDTFCRWIRARWNDLPILFLTVRSDPHDMVSVFGLGADDYVVKPFDLKVLHARILALLRRTEHSQAPRLSCDAILLDREKMTVSCDQEEITLSQPEYRILLLLMENKGKTVTRQQILEQVWDARGTYVNDNTLTVTIKRLREKLHHPNCLKTIRSFGYRMEDSK